MFRTGQDSPVGDDLRTGIAEAEYKVAGLTLIQLALGFVTAHPAVTSAIIGPRTMDHFHS